MLIQPQDGTWYVVVTCQQCNSTVVLFRDLTEGTGSLKATYGITCPNCNFKGQYDGRHYQHAEKKQ